MPASPADQSLADTPDPGRLRAWLALLRPPNLFTVPGDLVAGFAVAGGIGAGLWPRLPWVVAASLLLYASGLLLNDWCDRDIDAQERRTLAELGVRAVFTMHEVDKFGIGRVMEMVQEQL